MIVCTTKLVYDCCIRRKIPVEYAFRNENFFGRQVRKHSSNQGLLERYIYNAKLNNVDDDWIVVFDACMNRTFLEWLRERNPGKKLHFFYWNPLKLSLNCEFIPKEYKVWTYSVMDAKKYHLNYTPSFYVGEYEESSDCEIKYGASFIGGDKGRLKYVKEIVKLLEEHKISTYSYFTPDKWWKLYFHKDYQKRVSYRFITDVVKSSEAVIDYYMDIYTGQSQRVLEALFYEKKLITNNVVIKDEVFYKKENVFIIGVDPWDHIEAFMNTPRVPIAQEVKVQFWMENWLKKFVDS